MAEASTAPAPGEPGERGEPGESRAHADATSTTRPAGDGRSSDLAAIVAESLGLAIQIPLVWLGLAFIGGEDIEMLALWCLTGTFYLAVTILALNLAAPVMLLQIGTNVAGVIFTISGLHLLYLNTRVLPEALRPPMWRRVALVGMVLFYSYFTFLVARSLL